MTTVAAAQHPLDSLSGDEIETAVTVLQAEERVDLAALYPLITLEEPEKEEVLSWQRGQAISRRAFIIAKNRDQTFEAVVDITRREVVRWEAVEGVQPSVLLSEEWSYAQRIVMANREWREAIARRGIELRHVVCIPQTAGFFGIAEEAGRRLAKVVCYDSTGVRNFWARPIEGLLAVVDHREGKVMDVIDRGEVPVPRAPADFDEGSVGNLREPPKPIEMAQPQGQSFTIDGHEISWQKWRFHFRTDPRLGLVVSLVRYEDGGRLRSVLYQGSLSELFVPYMDPDLGWFFRTYLDAGEYGVGKLASVLERGVDCPTNAAFFDDTLADDWGGTYTKERTACLFERYAGDIAWRHHEAVTAQTETRSRVDLVLRQIATIGNYDYIFDWVFQQDGTIRVSVGATGIEQVKAVASRTATDANITYGRMVAEHTVAVNHDHFFCFRLDLDVDGRRNSLLYERLVQKRLPEDHPRKSLWVVEPEIPQTESEAKLRIDLNQPALWRVINPSVTGPVGYPVSYQLKPRSNAVSLLSHDDYPQGRAAFTDFHLWVTPYDKRERYAAGLYPNQSVAGRGLPSWTSADRSIESRDIVLWYTVGFHHVVRAEDWPVLPTNTSSFELRPFDFFERNPALDLPKPR